MIEGLEQVAHELDQLRQSGIIQPALPSRRLVVNHLYRLSQRGTGVVRHHVPEPLVLQVMLEHEPDPLGTLERA